MRDTQSDLRRKSYAGFVLGALTLVSAAYLSFTSLPHMKVAHGRFWLVSIAVLLSLLASGIAMLDRHLIATAPEAHPVPTRAQRQAGIILLSVQALVILIVGLVSLGRGRTDIGLMAVASSVVFAVGLALALRQPTQG